MTSVANRVNDPASKRKSAALVALFSFLLAGAFYYWSRTQGVEQTKPSTTPFKEAPHWRIEGRTMGTSFSIRIRSAKDFDADALRKQIQARLEAINDSMSTYRPDSEISRFNAMKAGESLKLSPDFAKVLTLAVRIAKRSQGTFDPTVAPLVRAWGFGSGAKTPMKEPSDQERKALLRWVGYTKLQFAAEQQRLTKAGREELDFSAIAKGYAVDEIAALLQKEGFADFMVEIGGELCASGRAQENRNWRVGVEAPSESSDSQRKVSKVIELRDQCMATSGSYRNYIEIQGKRRQHSIDPRNGESVDNGVISASVVAETAAQADGLATAMMVMGAQAARDLAQEMDLSLMLILDREGRLSIQRNSAFEALDPAGG